MTVIHMNIIKYLMTKDINNTADLIVYIPTFFIEAMTAIYIIN